MERRRVPDRHFNPEADIESTLTVAERHQFSDRLKHALENAGVSTSPSHVTRQFNKRADGAAVTVHAVRKWLVGEAIPTHERLLVLALWLEVHASWLLYGEAANTQLERVGDSAPLSPEQKHLLGDYDLLSEEGRRLVMDVVALLLETATFSGTEKTPEHGVRTKQSRRK